MRILEEKWRKIIREEIDKENLVGAEVLFMKDGEEVCFIGEGRADREKGVRMEEDTIFRLYSMTKPVTAVAAMIMIEQGKLKADRPVGDYLSAFKESKVWVKDHEEESKRPILVSDLWSMTSGLTYADHDTVPENMTRKLLKDAEESLLGNVPMKTREFAERAGQIPLLFHPGKGWKYGISADILGAVIEEVAECSFGEVLEKNIFEPLEMEDSGFWVPKDKQNRLARAYEKKEDGIFPYEGNFLGIRNTMDRKASFESGGAGLVSTVKDYAAFAEMLLNQGIWKKQRILKKESVKRMFSGKLSLPQRVDFESWFGQEGYDYSCLMRRLEDPTLVKVTGLQGEYCWDGWLGCGFWNYPNENMSLIIMQQQLGGGDIVNRIKSELVKYYSN